MTAEQLSIAREVVKGIPDRLSIFDLRALLSARLEAHEFVKASAVVDELLVYRALLPLFLERYGCR